MIKMIYTLASLMVCGTLGTTEDNGVISSCADEKYPRVEGFACHEHLGESLL